MKKTQHYAQLLQKMKCLGINTTKHEEFVCWKLQNVAGRSKYLQRHIADQKIQHNKAINSLYIDL